MKTKILETNGRVVFLCICLTWGLISSAFVAHTQRWWSDALLQSCLCEDWVLELAKGQRETETQMGWTSEKWTSEKENVCKQKLDTCTWHRRDRETQWSQTGLYLIQCVAGSYKSWELHRLEERLWDSLAALPRHPRQSGGLSHTSPSICAAGRERERENRISKHLSYFLFKVQGCFFFNAHGQIFESTEGLKSMF